MSSMEKKVNDSRTGYYITAVVVMALIGVVSILVLTIMRPGEDHIVVITLILGFLAPTTLSLLAFMKGQETSEQAKETHMSVNSRLDDFIKNAKTASHAEGVIEGQGMTMVNRIQGPIESDPAKPQVSSSVGFKVTSVFMRKEGG